MEQLVVTGGRPIHGEMIPAGNKNEALPCLAATLLASPRRLIHRPHSPNGLDWTRQRTSRSVPTVTTTRLSRR